MKVKNLNSHIEHIINGNKQQNQCYQQLLELSQQILHQLEDSISANYIESIEQVLHKRGEIVNSIKEIERNITTHKEAIMGLLHLKEFNLERVEDLINPNLIKELHEQKEATMRIIKTIIDSDSKNAEVLKNQRQNVADELRSIQQHFEIQQVYLDRPERFPESRFIDKKK